MTPLPAPAMLAASVLALLLLTSPLASAQNLKPGLWEINNRMQSGSGQVEKGMAEMQKQMAAMPPEQRKMMQDMMAKQGVAMGTTPGTMAVKICMTKDMVERNELPAQQGDCKTSSSPRLGNTMKMSFTCTQPPSSGEGTVTFVSPEAYSMKMVMKSNVQGKPETMTMDGGGKWLSADCGAVKPLAVPKK